MSRIAVVLALLVAWVGAGEVWAQWPAIESAPAKTGGGEQDVAHILTTEDYAFAPDVAGAETNGLASYRWFSQTWALRADRVRWLKNQEGKPAQILGAVASLRARVGEGGTFWFVSVAHGAPTSDASDGVLLGVAAQKTLTELYVQSLPQSALFSALEAGRQAAIVPVIDSSFSGWVDGQRGLSPGAPQTLLRERPSHLARNATLLTAGKSSEFAGPLPSRDRASASAATPRASSIPAPARASRSSSRAFLPTSRTASSPARR